MTLIKVPQIWDIPDRQITPESVFMNRRKLLKGLMGAGITASLLPLTACGQQNQSSNMGSGYTTPEAIAQNPKFLKGDLEITPQSLSSKYNNFYEFGTTKSIQQAAQALPTENWKVEVGGLVKNPQTYDMDDLRNKFETEERVYRFRCVEAWAMVVPWLGFPMRKLIEAVEPTSEAKFVRFTSWYDKQISTGPSGNLFSPLPWPYTEGLRIEEMANELAFFATGIYGQDLPKQHGAPIRQVIPWKYGFKGAKSIVKIEFLDTQPATFWNTIDAKEYDFEANVNPDKPHPRWSQATERLISDGSAFSWPRQPTLHYNGYGEWVAHLYG
ncbi:protein-methionine-sulfoxide reductase catalytic subunit MsrP [Roseofilum reptotaenium CS-1145]|uniref:Mononuclear molybdenum enzyme YedY n=1 Tax=Roseofilum reptotaenium AO1-A TaxID=1925591 RepID=A0A1L9QVV8_9CYAN|nr:protein-methionine-sulfoxide reductase catalytic subunit MsrP [Roseofilum reptotaenium]MDB9520183.1 protein-methionine-sulfoxide reductase catalytic subunit MsrP [Roseofilum reptotaenium CS-1145]OJJ26769.1 mononuclear molybdenum enzyme YedY [Roseofilum reptotaenium AO1-A]